MSGMTTYFIRRLMLVPVTFIVITFMVYAVLRFVPGGPIEQAEAQMKMRAAMGEGGAGGGTGDDTGLQLDEAAMRSLQAYYALDRSVFVGYLQWLGLWPREDLQRVPPVDERDHAEAIGELRTAAKAVADARRALDPLVASRDWIEQDGRLGETIDASALPEEVREKAGELAQRSFGERYPLRRFLAEHGFLRVGDAYAKEVPRAQWPEDVARAVDALQEAREALRAVVEETGYYLGSDGKPMQVAFRPLLDLNGVRNEAMDRIQGLLGPLDQIVYKGRVYRQLTPTEGDAFSKTDVHEDAEKLIRGGFGKRDELLDLLEEHGKTWRGAHYYTRLEPDAIAAGASLYQTIDDLVAARHLANADLARAKAERNFEVTEDGAVYRVERGLAGVLELDFGNSYTYNEPVLSIIGSRIKISLWFGLTGYILTWIVCVPLGVFKAVHHRKAFDTLTSIIVFLGYSFPGFVLCIVLLTKAKAFGLPLGGFEPENVDQLGPWQTFLGRARHMVIPVAGYMVTQFAAMTILMKNSLLENLGQDYVRTAFAKGLSEKRVIFVHALRNSLIPITAGIGNALGLLFAGSFLIEKATNVPGMGLLGYEAILQRDYPIILALLVFLVVIRLFGNIVSDIIWAMIDPRIRFG